MEGNWPKGSCLFNIVVKHIYKNKKRTLRGTVSHIYFMFLRSCNKWGKSGREKRWLVSSFHGTFTCVFQKTEWQWTKSNLLLNILRLVTFTGVGNITTNVKCSTKPFVQGSKLFTLVALVHSTQVHNLGALNSNNTQ